METSIITAEPDKKKGKQQIGKEKNPNEDDDLKKVEISADEIFQEDIYELEEERKEMERSIEELSGELERTKMNLRSTLQLLGYTEKLSDTGSFEMDLNNGVIKGSETFHDITGIDKEENITMSRLIFGNHPNNDDIIDIFLEKLHIENEIHELDFNYAKPEKSTKIDLHIKTITLPGQRSGEKKVIGILRVYDGSMNIEEEKDSSSEDITLNSVMIEREMRIIEMKKEVNQLCIELGIDPRYSDFEN